MGIARRLEKIRFARQQAKINEPKIKALLDYRRAVELEVASHESTGKVAYISQDEFLFIHEGKHADRDKVIRGLQHFQKLIQIDFMLKSVYNVQMSDGWATRTTVPVINIPLELIKSITKDMPPKEKPAEPKLSVIK